MGKGEKLFTGVGAAKGEVVATVRIVNGDETKMAQVTKGEVLVSQRFDPQHDKYVEKAVAIIQNTGGIKSHGAYIGKKLGIPAVTGTVEATSVLKDGQKVVVDGDNGIVYDYVPGMVIEDISTPAPKAAEPLSLAARMAAIAKQKGKTLPPGFIESLKKQE
ncbi:hypothetical protein LCGC14_2958260 [marine sediment metagenome]|uniref:PEP-utilising enzyme mobile domain-containing protein n=1 Tax=marine sediment metagenome TaxID=412755 RepID=A0A0F8ZKT3_9ZZZZ